jgi:hypothetical protein
MTESPIQVVTKRRHDLTRVLALKIVAHRRRRGEVLKHRIDSSIITAKTAKAAIKYSPREGTLEAGCRTSR